MSVCEAAGERLAPRVGRPFSLPSIIKVSGHTESSEGGRRSGDQGSNRAFMGLIVPDLHIYTHTHSYTQTDRYHRTPNTLEVN